MPNRSREMTIAAKRSRRSYDVDVAGRTVLFQHVPVSHIAQKTYIKQLVIAHTERLSHNPRQDHRMSLIRPSVN